MIARALEEAVAIGFELTNLDGRLETGRAPRGWEMAETSVEQVDYQPSPRAANDNDRGQER